MTSRGLKIALAVSLAVNLFVIGGFAGATIMRQQMLQARMERGGALMRAGEGLSEAQRVVFREKMRETGRSAGPRLRAAREARREAQRLMAAPTYDEAAVSAALTRARANETAARADLEAAVVTFARGLGPEDRAALSRALRPGRPPGGLRPDRRGDGPRPDRGPPDLSSPRPGPLEP